MTTSLGNTTHRLEQLFESLESLHKECGDVHNRTSSLRELEGVWTRYREESVQRMGNTVAMERQDEVGALMGMFKFTSSSVPTLERSQLLNQELGAMMQVCMRLRKRALGWIEYLSQRQGRQDHKLVDRLLSFLKHDVMNTLIEVQEELEQEQRSFKASSSKGNQEMEIESGMEGENGNGSNGGRSVRTAKGNAWRFQPKNVLVLFDQMDAGVLKRVLGDAVGERGWMTDVQQAVEYSKNGGKIDLVIVDGMNNFEKRCWHLNRTMYSRMMWEAATNKYQLHRHLKDSGLDGVVAPETYFIDPSGSIEEQLKALPVPSGKEPWIWRPENGRSGIGISVVTDLQQLRECMVTLKQNANQRKRKSRAIISRYLTNPSTIGGYKYHLRLYLLVVKEGREKRAALFRLGKIVVGQKKYDFQDVEFADKGIHDTHTTKDMDYRFPRDFKDDNGFQAEEVFGKCCEMLGSMCQQVLGELKTFDQDPKGFEIHGVDMMVDANGKVWLIEINQTPRYCYEDAGENNPEFQKWVSELMIFGLEEFVFKWENDGERELGNMVVLEVQNEIVEQKEGVKTVFVANQYLDWKGIVDEVEGYELVDWERAMELGRVDLMMLEGDNIWDSRFFSVPAVTKSQLSVKKITNKINLHKSLMDAGVDFIPETQVIWKDWDNPIVPEKPDGLWIWRPEFSWGGRDIHVLCDQSDMERVFSGFEKFKGKKRRAIISRYIDNPRLIDGRKFHLRLYFLVTMFGNRLRGGLLKDGRILMSNKEYEARDYQDKDMHDSHYNEYARMFPSGYPGGQEAAEKEVYPQMQSMLATVMELLGNTIKVYDDAQNGYTILGIDIMIDDLTGKLMLIEFNGKPGFNGTPEMETEASKFLMKAFGEFVLGNRNDEELEWLIPVFDRNMDAGNGDDSRKRAREGILDDDGKKRERK